MIDINHLDREQRVEARTIAYVQHAKRMMLDLFGQEAARHQPEVTMQLVSAMIQLEAADITAEAQHRLADAILTSKES